MFYFFIFYFVFCFNFDEVSVHIFYDTIYMHMKFQTRRIQEEYIIYIQSRVTIYNFEQVSISGMHINVCVLGIVLFFRIDDSPQEKSC